MEYKKPALTVDQQVELLISRGMEGDRNEMRDRLTWVSYYRLSGYWYPYRLPNSDMIKPGTQFSRVWESYVFDRELRLLFMDAIERIEIAIRTQIAYEHSLKFGPFGYADNPRALPLLLGERRTKFFEDLEEESDRSQERFVEHFGLKYSNHDYLPIWMAIEVLSFGRVLVLFNGCPLEVRQAIAKPYKVDHEVLSSWLLSLNTIRNVCAHHCRLWNRDVRTAPKIPRKAIEWQKPMLLDPKRVFTILTIANYCLRVVAPSSEWAKRWRALIEGHPSIHRKSLGMPTNWLESSLWANATFEGEQLVPARAAGASAPTQL